jgi:hypothetical protein
MPKPTVRLDGNLVLFRFLLHQFGYKSLDEMAEGLKFPRYEEYTEENRSRFLDAIENRKNLSDSFVQRLYTYDDNIYRHTQHISQRRNTPMRWKYFQYLCLLFTEIYLDWYFRDSDDLQKTINAYLADELKRDLTYELSPYSSEELNKLAIWQATGSGKTLLMHMQILMLEHYLQHYDKRHEYNKYILITPNEGLSQQHLAEFRLSNIPAEIFGTGTSFGIFSHDQRFAIEIIEISKFKEEKGKKTVAVEAFGINNIVLIDEGHRGTSGTEWKRMRDTISEEGFAIEYSATFGQAIQSRDKQFSEYAKAILFDYSYRFFYNDGYGKEYRILNIRENAIEDNYQTYLVATLLAYYEQLYIYDEQANDLKLFNIAKPLMVFVGSSVNAVSTRNRMEVSDVVEILLFLNAFIQNRAETIQQINAIIKGSSGLVNSSNQDVFSRHFNVIREKYAEEIYDDMLRLIFNAPPQSTELVLEDLKGIDGEIGVRVGVNDYFCVINVGDTPKLLSLCEKNGLITTEQPFSYSLFQSINEALSPIQILIGSKKFTEGWNSWRVSTMGLLNVGRSEGSQIIQLFGRGVRLRGYQNTLKRSSRLDDKPDSIPSNLATVESLNIFGVRADYMEQFKSYLEAEGLPTNDDYEITMNPMLVVEDLGKIKLQWFDLDPKRARFKDAVKVDCADRYEGRAIQLVLYTKLQSMESAAQKADEITLQEYHLQAKHLAFLDKSAIGLELQKYKREKGWTNLTLNVDSLLECLLDNTWYAIYAPASIFDFDGSDKIRLWERDIAVPLLKKYLNNHYLSQREKYESTHRVYVELSPDDDNFIKQYRFMVDESRKKLISDLERIRDDIEALKDDVEPVNGIQFVTFSRHLYKPLVYIDAKLDYIKVIPTPLNKGERDFVADLRDYYRRHLQNQQDVQIYLLRNQSRGKGLGFFEASNFYPDFVLWILRDGKQYINFIDPKGIGLGSVF